MKSYLNTHLLISVRAGLFLLFFFIGNADSYQAHAQDNQYVKIKAFDESLKPYGNIKVKINQGDFVELNELGTAFTNLKSNNFPIKSIEINDDMLEAASWNFSKGVLEITIRKKSYRDAVVIIKTLDNELLVRQPFTFKGTKTVNSTTGTDGSVSIPLALNEQIKGADQFTLKNYKPVSITNTGGQYILRVDLVNKEQNLVAGRSASNQTSAAEPLQEGRIIPVYNLDSIESLPVLYALLKEVKLDELSQEERNRIDAKFDELFDAIANSDAPDSSSYMTNITDSTIVESDLRNLLKEIRRESQRLDFQKSEFNSKMELIREKLNQGFENLDNDARAELLRDLNLLEELLASNRSEFMENQSFYLTMIADLKDRFFDIEKLEGQLSESEQRRLEEKRLYQQRILAISGLVLLFGVMLVFLLYLGRKLKKQQKQLISANAEIKNINQNLEDLVAQRTLLLQKTYQELDMVLYRASHDLRGPLCSITGLSNLISLNSDDDELTDLILKTNNKMDRLLRKLSTISEIHQPGTLNEINVASLANEVIQRFDEVRNLQATALEVHCDDDLKIVSVPYLLEVIIYSLIENAIYYSGIKRGQSGKVELRLERKGNNLEIEVYDNGIGIDKSMVGKLFDMFYIGTESSKGNGLGLYIVQKSVDLLKGNITVESELGEYTRVIIRIPLDENQQGVPIDFLVDKDPVLN